MTSAPVPAAFVPPGVARPVAPRLAALLLAVLFGASVLRLIPEWRSNPDLSHGWFTPLLLLILWHESRTRGRLRWLPSAGWARGGAALAAGGGLLLLGLGSLYAVALDWTHPLVEYLLGLATAGALLAALFLAASPTVRWQPWNWPALAAIVLWVLSLPLPPGSYAALTLQLQLGITQAVLTSLHALGIPALHSGNVIDLGHTSVGVEEACSGIRSLLSCLYAGVFFSATLVTRPLRRVALILLAPLLALALNYLRSLGLTLLAHRGVDLRGAWHDATGFAILGTTALLLAALAWGFGHKSGPPAPDAPAHPALTRGHRTAFGLLAGAYSLALVWVVALALGTRPASMTEPVPDLAAMLPADSPGWDWVGNEDLTPYAPLLQTGHLVQRTYLRHDPAGVTQLTVYLAYWAPGQAPVSVVASHTPDLCWPGAGWTLQPGASATARLVTGDRALNPAQYRRFDYAGLPQHVWFWHVYQHQVIASPDALSPRDLLRAVFSFGIRSRGDQLFVRLSSNRPWPEIADDPLVQELFLQLQPYGL